MRASGILLPLFSLPSPYGIGTMGKAAYEFVDFLKEAGQTWWQMLPIGPISYGDSPYQSFSTFAGNPYFIDFDLLAEDGLLAPSDYTQEDWGGQAGYIDYELLFEKRFQVLKKAYAAGFERDKEQIEAFQRENPWVGDYALFMALKFHFELKAWKLWEKDIRTRKPEALEKYRDQLSEDVGFWIYCQFLFYRQWEKLKTYAGQKGIRLIGDIPIYVAEDSADAWANPELFQFDEDLNPTRVAGCPPDAFTADGQLWGNPLYRWEVHIENGFSWWMKRIEAATRLFDMIRIDHFRGFAGYYAIPYGDTTARNGKWEPGPGKAFVDAVKKNFKGISIIAEDLGFLTPDVIKLQKGSGFPGMKVLEFAFDPWSDSDYLPHHYEKNSVVYTGTHDNDTAMGWYQSQPKKVRDFCKEYLKLNKREGIHWGLIRGAWSSTGDLAVAQMQDFLALGSEARMNTPSTLGGNWRWRLLPGQCTQELAEQIHRMTKLYGRLPQSQKSGSKNNKPAKGK